MTPTSLLLVINIVLLLFCIHAVTTNPRLAPLGKVLWIAFIIIAPLVGSICYLVFGGGLRLPRFRDRRAEWERRDELDR